MPGAAVGARAPTSTPLPRIFVLVVFAGLAMSPDVNLIAPHARRWIGKHRWVAAVLAGLFIVCVSIGRSLQR